MRPRTLLVLSARADRAARDAVAAGRWPRKDFLELTRALRADVIDYATVERGPLRRTIAGVFGVPITQALLAFSRRRRYDAIFADGEHIGLPLAVLCRFGRRRPRLVTIGHLLGTPLKRAVFRWLKPHAGIDALLVHATAQQRLATRDLGLRPAQVPLVPYQVDTDFWRAAPSQPTEAMICTAGLEYRDYPTFIAAMRGLPVRAVIAAGSRWSRHQFTPRDTDLPPNVEVTALDYPALRDLYARARFVVVPLHDIDNQAGITVILEAMAMAKAVVLTATRGQRDVIRGRTCTAAGLSDQPAGGPAAFGVSGALAEVETGLYVPPADPAALRHAIRYLLDHPAEAERMGRAGRQVVEEHMSLDRFVEQISRIVGTSGRTALSPESSAGHSLPSSFASATIQE